KRSTTKKVFAIAAVTALALAVAPAARAQGTTCSNRTLNGTFADTDIGFLTAPPAMAGPFAGVSRQTYDGNGNLTGTGFGNINGTIVAITQKGTYTVNADCTGTYTVQVSPLGITVHGYFVIADGGNELRILVTDPDTVIACTARKQFPSTYWQQ